MTSLSGRRILYIAPRFFGYERDIAAELQRRGALLDVMKDRPFDTPLLTAVTRFRRSWIMAAADRYYRHSLAAFGRSAYDIIFVVNGQTLSEHILAELRASYPAAKFILYMWDSIENRPSVLANMKFFDECFTFDPKAAVTYGMNFRPSFFSTGFERPPTHDHSYDISFVGTAHTDRMAIISSIRSSLRPERRAYWYLYLQAPWVFYAYKLTNPAFRTATRNEFRFAPLAKNDVQEVFFRSRAVLDIEHPRQTGLTMRPFEAMGASKKLVTTSASIRAYDFYDPDNICVVDRQDARVPDTFLDSPYRAPSPQLYNKYRLETWMDDVLAGRGSPVPDLPLLSRDA